MKRISWSNLPYYQFLQFWNLLNFAKNKQKFFFRKDLVKQRIYFLIDLICAASSYLIHRQFLWLIILQNIQHIFYFMTWEKR